MPTRRPRTPPALPSSTLPIADRIDVGSRYATQALVDHARAVLAKMPAYPFDTFGFLPAWTHALEALIASIETQLAALDASHEAALPTGAALDAASANAKAYRREALAVIAIQPGVAHHKLPKTSGSSVAGLVTSLRALAPRVATAAVTPHGTGRAMRAKGLALLAALDTARVAHKKALAKLSPEARALHAEKGTLYEELKRVARVGRHLAPQDPTLRATTTHLRAVHHRTHAAPPAPPAPPTP